MHICEECKQPIVGKGTVGADSKTYHNSCYDHIQREIDYEAVQKLLAEFNVKNGADIEDEEMEMIYDLYQGDVDLIRKELKAPWVVITMDHTDPSCTSSADKINVTTFETRNEMLEHMEDEIWECMVEGWTMDILYILKRGHQRAFEICLKLT